MLVILLNLLLILFIVSLFVYVLVGIPLMYIQSIREDKQAKTKAEEVGACYYLSCIHIKGLPVKKKARCRIYAVDGKIIIKAKQQELSVDIPKDKIQAVFNKGYGIGLNSLNIIAYDKANNKQEMSFYNNFGNKKIKRFVKSLNKEFLPTERTFGF